MASTNTPSSHSKLKNSTWTAEENKSFEIGLAKYYEDTPDRWQKIARNVEGKSEEEVKMQYHLLLQEIALIEAGNFPLPHYYTTNNANSCDADHAIKETFKS